MKKDKRKRNYRGRVVRTILFLSIIGVWGIITYQYLKESKEEINPKDTDKSEVEEDKQEYSLSFVMVGDNLIHDKIYLEALNLGENSTYNFKPLLSYMKPIIKKYDIAYYNQETILGGKDIGLSGYPVFNSPFEVGDAMIDAGFNLVSLATNHTLDRGSQAIYNSRNYWNSKPEVLVAGSYSSIEEKEQIPIKEKNHITYTMLNYTYGTNGIPVPSGQEYLVNIWPVHGNNPNTDSEYQNYKEQVKKDIEGVRDKVDVLIVAMHWGVEYQLEPNDYQKDMAKYLVSLGVDIVIGTHPHVIQPVTWIDDTLVIYSLGNFISTHEVVNLSNRIGLMSSVRITKIVDKDKTSEMKIDNLENELLYTYYTSDYKDIKVIPFSKLEEKYLANYKEVYIKYREVIQSIDNSIPVVKIEG